MGKRSVGVCVCVCVCVSPHTRRYIAPMHLISPTTKNCGRVKRFQYSARYEEDMKMEKRRERDPYIFTSSLPLSLCFSVCVFATRWTQTHKVVGVPVGGLGMQPSSLPLHPFFCLPSFSLLPAFSHSLKHTHTHTRRNRRQSDSPAFAHKRKRKNVLVFTFFSHSRLTLFTESFVDELQQPFTPWWNRLEKLIPKMGI